MFSIHLPAFFPTFYIGLPFVHSDLKNLNKVGEDLTHGALDSGDRGMNPISTITFSYAAIHFRAVYHLQNHQRPVPPMPCLYGVGGYKDPLSH